MDNITHIIIKFELKDKRIIIYKIYYLLKTFYITMIENNKETYYTLINNKIFNKFFKNLFKIHLYDINKYSFKFNDTMEIYNDTDLRIKEYTRLLSDFIGYLKEFNTEINNDIMNEVLIKHSYNNISKNLPVEIINQILKWLRIQEKT